MSQPACRLILSPGARNSLIGRETALIGGCPGQTPPGRRFTFQILSAGFLVAGRHVLWGGMPRDFWADNRLGPRPRRLIAARSAAA